MNKLVGLTHVFEESLEKNAKNLGGARSMPFPIARRSHLVRSLQSSGRAYWPGLVGTTHEASAGLVVLVVRTSPCDHAPRGTKSNLLTP